MNYTYATVFFFVFIIYMMGDVKSNGQIGDIRSPTLLNLLLRGDKYPLLAVESLPLENIRLKSLH